MVRAAPMQSYSAYSLFKQALGGHAGWQRQWRSPEPKAEYDVIIVAPAATGSHRALSRQGTRHHQGRGGREGLARGGNTGRNTTIIRSNYLFDESAALYEHA